MAGGVSKQGRKLAEQILMGVLLLSIALGCGYVLYPFFSAILWAAIFVFSTWPPFSRLRQMGLNRTVAALIMVLLAAIVVVIPFSLVIPAGAHDLAHLHAVLQTKFSDGLPSAPAWLADVPLIGGVLTDAWNNWTEDISAFGVAIRPYLGAIAEAGLNVLLRIAHGIASFGLALFISFFFYVYGDSIAAEVRAILRRIAGDYADRLVTVTGLAVRGTVYGILGNAIIQGALCFLGFYLLAVPRAALLAVLAGAFALVPGGAPVVWIPAGIWLMIQGSMARGIFLLGYGTVVISGLDHFIRPYLIARGARLPFLLTVLGVLGGVFAYGLLGIFLGPVLLGIGLILLREFAGGAELPPPDVPNERAPRVPELSAEP
jgi:predicted PurR-regulated permease PerM